MPASAISPLGFPNGSGEEVHGADRGFHTRVLRNSGAGMTGRGDEGRHDALLEPPEMCLRVAKLLSSALREHQPVPSALDQHTPAGAADHDERFA